MGVVNLLQVWSYLPNVPDTEGQEARDQVPSRVLIQPVQDWVDEDHLRLRASTSTRAVSSDRGRLMC